MREFEHGTRKELQTSQRVKTTIVMAKYGDLPPEIIIRVASCLTFNSKDIRALLNLSQVCKSTYAAIQGAQELWRAAYLTYWDFESAGLRGRTSDLYNRKDPQVSHGCTPALEADLPRTAFYKRQRLDLQVVYHIEEMVRGTFGYAHEAEALVKIGMNAADMLGRVRTAAAGMGHYEVRLMCEEVLHGISSSLGDRLLKQICTRPKLAPWRDQVGVAAEAMDGLFAVGAYHYFGGVRPDLNIEDHIKFMADDVMKKWPHEKGCKYAKDVTKRCVCLTSVDGPGAFRAVEAALSDYSVTVVDPSSSGSMQPKSNYLGYSLEYEQPVTPLVVVCLFCAVARHLGLVTEPVDWAIHVVASITFKENGVEIEKYWSPYVHGEVHPTGEIYTREELIYAVRDTLGWSYIEANDSLNPLDGIGAARRTVDNISDCLEAAERRPELTICMSMMKTLHRCGEPLVTEPYDFANMLSVGDLPTFGAWIPELREMARRGGFDQSSADSALHHLEAVRNEMNKPIQVAPRQKPDQPIRYAIGSVVRHRKHKYAGFIYAHEEDCKESEAWQREMRIHKLEGGGANQPFYHVRMPDGQSMYMPEVNVELMTCPRCGDRNALPTQGPTPLTSELTALYKKFDDEVAIGRYVSRKKNSAGKSSSMALYNDLPPEIIVRIATYLIGTGEGAEVKSFLRLTMVCASTRSALRTSQKLWKDAYTHCWIFENAGVRGRTADLYNREDPQVFPGCTPALETDAPVAPYFNVEKKIEDIVELVFQRWRHEKDCDFTKTGKLNCRCFKNRDGPAAFRAIQEATYETDLCAMGPDIFEFSDLECHYLAEPLLSRQPASAIVLAVIFGAIAKRLGLLAAPIAAASLVVVKICYNQDGTERQRYMALCSDQIYTFEGLIDFLQARLDCSRETALEHSKVMRGPMLAAYCARSVLRCVQDDTGTKLASPVDYLGAMKCLYWSGRPMEQDQVLPHQFADLVGRFDIFSSATWRQEMPHLAKTGGFTYDHALHANEVLEDYRHLHNGFDRIVRRNNPDRAIRFALGSVICHRKHKFLGIVFGFDDECMETPEWQEQMRVNKLKGGGPNQPFYHVRTIRGSDMYIAEQNIKLLSCARCGDREAQTTQAPESVPSEILAFMNGLERLPEEYELGRLVMTRKNDGKCGYVPSSAIQHRYSAKVWPRVPNACSQQEGCPDLGPDEE
ncbi:hypothetical protein BCR37DRAFT_391975 [Protomyces lactucae-debilis]|uniref:Hemimethylated DNA-binding domain-containing protein n=1 Tax=Protomyces lactucae-debilis TaxID=2754530 RepID=A0A1Y2FK89_PROLT|nr:uncharacterized protein BCR37DRAFT_391975 [Protomyces lactucae-debilis]ORY84393.1 hypothetical protein BCR37DRAFT_391975 [Protomyces lactucae-debilis]